MDTQDLIIRENIRISKHREKIVLALMNGPMTPSEISEVTNLRRSSVSRSIKHLKGRDLVYQTNAPKYRNKLYALTPLGERISKFL